MNCQSLGSYLKSDSVILKCYPLHIQRLDDGRLGRAFAKLKEIPFGHRHEGEAESEVERLHLACVARCGMITDVSKTEESAFYAVSRVRTIVPHIS